MLGKPKHAEASCLSVILFCPFISIAVALFRSNAGGHRVSGCENGWTDRGQERKRGDRQIMSETPSETAKKGRKTPYFALFSPLLRDDVIRAATGSHPRFNPLKNRSKSFFGCFGRNTRSFPLLSSLSFFVDQNPAFPGHKSRTIALNRSGGMVARRRTKALISPHSALHSVRLLSGFGLPPGKMCLALALAASQRRCIAPG